MWLQIQLRKLFDILEVEIDSNYFTRKSLMKKNLIIIKSVWVVFILGALLLYAFENSDEMLATFSGLSMLQIYLSISLLLVGKLFCIFLVMDSIKLQDFELKFQKATYWYSYSDMGKYLPGGIWAIVGRFSLYKETMGAKRSSAAFFAETLFIIGVPSVISLILISRTSIFPQIINNITILLAIFIFIFIFSATIYTASKKIKRDTRNIILSRMCISQSICWTVLLPMSFYVICPDNLMLSHVIAAFNAGFSAGQLAIFAPSGIGVREFVANLFVVSSESGNFLTLLITHRFLWVIADIIMFVVATTFNIKSKG